MEKIFEQALLYDFYGELLTEHQRSIYEDAVFNDMSLGEIAEVQGISRQGVHDLIKRCDKILQDYESKLHLVDRFEKAKEKIGEIIALTGCGGDMADIAEPLTVDGVNAEKNAEPVTVNDANTGMSAETENDSTGYAQRMRKICELSQELIKEW